MPELTPPLPGRVDLHTHSAYSDGVLSPSDLIAEAKRAGVSRLGLTDHDTLAGLPEANRAANEAGIELIPGVELSADEREVEVHILGYFVPERSPVLNEALARFARDRVERIETIVDRLIRMGIRITQVRVREIAGTGSIGRPHIARALIEAGYGASVNEVFDAYLAPGCPAYVPSKPLSPELAVELLRDAGAAPVLAHPRSVGDIPAMLRRLKPVGLVGLECFYGEYDVPTRERLAELANEWLLIPTGGSDFHGVGFKPGRDLGGPDVPAMSVDRLREATGR
ncbi:MAG: PHP domain-containing protein [Rhizobiales bacterium]|nr:PHP domain-containing protein [Hyphomicrobiales bacterium]